MTGNGFRVLWSGSILRPLFLRYYTRTILRRFSLYSPNFFHIEKWNYNKDVTSVTNVKLQYSGSGYQKDDGMDEGVEVRPSMVHTFFNNINFMLCLLGWCHMVSA